MNTRLPAGVVTFLFTDIEGSTKLLHELGDEYAAALGEHRRIVREAFGSRGGVEVDTQGDAFFVAFARASDAVAAAADAQRGLDGGPIRVRMGLHSGEPLVTDEGYVGLDVHKGARIAAVAHGGQVLLSEATRALVDAQTRDLGHHRLKDLTAPQRIYQLEAEGLHPEFPPLKTLDAGLTNLPSPRTSFVGRKEELDEIDRRLEDPECRLLTLVGPGGIGKTRLALEAAARRLDSYAHGVHFVSLASGRQATENRSRMPASGRATPAGSLGARSTCCVSPPGDSRPARSRTGSTLSEDRRSPHPAHLPQDRCLHPSRRRPLGDATHRRPVSARRPRGLGPSGRDVS